MILRHLHLAVAGAGAAAVLAGCGAAQTTLEVQPAAATRPVASPAGAAPAAGDCDTGRWTGAVSPEGRPDSLDAGDTGALYVWHDGDGWHVRTTDRRASDHHYTGTIRVLPGGGFADVRTVRDERDDHVSIDGGGVLRYDFHTFASIDGVDFRVTCPAGAQSKADRQRLAFQARFDGQPVPDRVRIGDSKRSPRSADFRFTRSA